VEAGCHDGCCSAGQKSIEDDVDQVSVIAYHRLELLFAQASWHFSSLGVHWLESQIAQTLGPLNLSTGCPRPMVFCPAKERTDKVEDSPCHSVGRELFFRSVAPVRKGDQNFDELLWSDPARTMYLLALPGDKALLSWVAKDLFTAFNPRLNIELGTTSFSILCLELKTRS
jgi:hypothetical protein